jgi:hypothetical protein
VWRHRPPQQPMPSPYDIPAAPSTVPVPPPADLPHAPSSGSGHNDGKLGGQRVVCTSGAEEIHRCLQGRRIMMSLAPGSTNFVSEV